MKNVLLFFSVLFILKLTTYSQHVETLTTTFNASGGLSVDANGFVYVADFGTSLSQPNGTKVYRIEKDGTINEFASGLQGASGNAFDSQGNLFQSNIAGNKLSKITPNGTLTDFAVRNLFSPVGVAVAANDTIYVANCGGGSISKVTPSGQPSVWVTSDLLNCPNGLAIDENGNLYTCNFNNGDVIKIDQNKNVSILATLPTSANGHLTYKNGVLYVAARCDQSIYEVKLNGDFKKIAGTGERGNDDGPALEATFNHPNGIDASPDGDTLYINDATPLGGNCLTALLNPVVVRMIIGVKSITNADDSKSAKPAGYKLMQNYPNPFNPSTTIRYSIPKSEFVSIKITDVIGRELLSLVEDEKSAGEYKVEFDVNDLSSGIYFYSIRAGNFNESKKLIVIK